MPGRAAIFIQRGVSSSKQTTACLRYILAEHWSPQAIVPFWQPADAVRLARDGRIDTLVAAFDSKVVQQLADDLDGDAEVIVVHPQPKIVAPRRHGLGSIGDLILRWWRRGKTVEQIAIDVDGDTTDVRAILRRYGEDPGRSP